MVFWLGGIMSDKLINRLVIFLSTGLFFFLLFTLTKSDTTVDPDTVSSLLRFGQGTVSWENPIIWNVHIFYGTYLLISTIFTSHLIAPVAFLSAISTVVFLLAGFQILKNHLSRQNAFYGFLLIMVIPGYHLLNLRLEDNLPLLAGIMVMAAALDTMHLKSVTFSKLLIFAAGFTFALLFHTVAIVFICTPLLLLFQKTDIKRRFLHIAVAYLMILILMSSVLALLPDGFKHFSEAYSGSYGIENSISAFSNDSEAIIKRVQKDWILPFRVVNNIPLDINKIDSQPIRLVFIACIVFTNIIFYGFLIYGSVLSLKKWRSNLVILTMLLISLAIPIGLAAFTIERVDMPVLFAVLTACIGLFGVEFPKKRKQVLQYWYYLLILVLFLWDGALYAQCARWFYHPQQYTRYKSIILKNDINYEISGTMLFNEEESLFENNDYFIFIREYPKMVHYGIEADGKIYRIDGGWINDKSYLTELEKKEVCYGFKKI